MKPEEFLGFYEEKDLGYQKPVKGEENDPSKYISRILIVKAGKVNLKFLLFQAQGGEFQFLGILKRPGVDNDCLSFCYEGSDYLLHFIRAFNMVHSDDAKPRTPGIEIVRREEA